MLLTIDDLRLAAQKRLPRAVFGFIEGGAEDEVTLARNRAAFQRLELLPRAMVDVSEIDLRTDLFGETLSAPLVLAPTGLCGIATSRPEIAAARAAVGAGIPFTASCMSSVTLEEIAREIPGGHWFQLYVWRDRDITRELVQRAQAESYRALVVTIDVPVLGQRERDVRNRATIPPQITIRNALDVLRRPRWLRSIMTGPPVTFANVAAAYPSRGMGRFALAPIINGLFDPSVTWNDLDWLRGLWRGPLLVKGILSAEDARLAVLHGADGIIVSNHGGRQLDGAPASIEALPAVVDAIRGEAAVILDGGIRRGSDWAKALALGADAGMIGRPYLYGLAVGREQGARRAIDILTTELRRVMALLGCVSIGDLRCSRVRDPLNGRPRLAPV
jgi:isopentenyl diphosphate isomerase/L-lactate dehydrogenase-like FMN-dependent dehydrogenase